MHPHNAKKQFDENRSLFGNPHSEPEKFNLYAGLANLASALVEIENRLDQIEHELRILRNK